jgi:acyl carrier protein
MLGGGESIIIEVVGPEGTWMTAEPARDDPAREWPLADMIALLRMVTGEDARWAAEITASTRLERDLSLDSLEMAALCDLARETFGDQADLAAFVSGLDIDQIIGLTVGELAAQVAAVQCAPANPAALRPPSEPGAASQPPALRR